MNTLQTWILNKLHPWQPKIDMETLRRAIEDIEREQREREQLGRLIAEYRPRN